MHSLPHNQACHAYNNKKTEKTKWFWQDGGHLYIYSIYGNNNCLNITAADKDKPEAVLIRAVEPLEGHKLMHENRGGKLKRDRELTNGPGKLAQAMQIDKSFNGLDIRRKGKMYITEGNYKFFSQSI